MASCLTFVALPLLFFSFSGNAQPFDYPTAIAPTTWINSPSLPNRANTSDGSVVLALILRLSTAHAGPSFAAGFYCFFPCKSFYFSVYIVYANSAAIIRENPPQVIWTANWAHAVGQNATLELTAQSGLTLRDSDGSLVWTTDVANRSVAGINITEYGNMVLFDTNNVSIWQSFDHPTDSLVLGQSLAVDMSLIANSSSTNLTENQLYVTFRGNGLYAFVNSDPPQLYYQRVSLFTNRTVDKSAFMKFMNGSLTMFSPLSNPNKAVNLFYLPPAKSIQYMRLESDGHLKLYDYLDMNGRTDWNIVADLFNRGGNMGNCDYPTVCGHYGICRNGQCSCPIGTKRSYFVPVDSRRGELGCFAGTPITCEDINNHHLLVLNNVSYFSYIDNNAEKFSSNDEVCKKTCLGNCSCKAAMFLSLDGNTSNGMCFPVAEVYSLKNHQSEETRTFNSSVYIKMQAAPSPPPSPPPSSVLPPQQHSSRVLLGAALGTTFGALIILLIIIYLLCLRKGKEAQDEDVINPGPKRFTFGELESATKNFSKILGIGGFGTVFEGTLVRQGKSPHPRGPVVEKIAVKQLKDNIHGQQDFMAEAYTIGKIHHINLVRLIGFCADRSNKLLVFEYMSNGSLDKWIYSNSESTLDWCTRFKIITHVSKGLCYLHEECAQCILHLDIKPANILLDEKFNAKISDFGLSKLIDREESRVMSGVGGTIGYLAPEWNTGLVTEKFDVYSFGVVVMEILCGRRNLDNSQAEESRCLIKLLEKKTESNQLLDLIDKNLSDIELHKEKITKVMELAMQCLQWDNSRRPSMSDVVKVLEEISVEQRSDPVVKVDQTAPLLTFHVSRNGERAVSEVPRSNSSSFLNLFVNWKNSSVNVDRS